MNIENAVNIINTSNLLKENELQDILNLKEELAETFAKSQVFRTRTEMEVSVLNDLHFPTHAAKYWQAVREQNVHFTELVELSYEYRRKCIEIKKLKRKLEKEEDDLERELIQIDIEREEFHLRQMEKVARDRLREVKEWSDIKKREMKHMTKEELEDVNNHQLISYTKRFIQEAMLIDSNTEVAVKISILGHLKNALQECIRKEVLNEVLKDLPDNQKLFLAEVLNSEMKQDKIEEASIIEEIKL